MLKKILIIPNQLSKKASVVTMLRQFFHLDSINHAHCSSPANTPVALPANGEGECRLLQWPDGSAQSKPDGAFLFPYSSVVTGKMTVASPLSSIMAFANSYQLHMPELLT